jgi:hypothetical protein
MSLPEALDSREINDLNFAIVCYFRFLGWALKNIIPQNEDFQKLQFAKNDQQ